MELIYILNGMLITQSLQLSNRTEIDIHLNFFFKKEDWLLDSQAICQTSIQRVNYFRKETFSVS